MNRSGRVMRLVQKQLPGSVVCGSFLALEKTGMLLRGFGLYATGRKNHTNLHRAVIPLWCPRDNTLSHYNKRLHHPTTGWTILDPNDYAKSAATVLWQIGPHVNQLKDIATVEDFRTRFEFMRPNRNGRIQLDFAIADYLVNDLKGCETALSYVEQSLKKIDCGYLELRRVVAQVRKQFDADPKGLRDLIEAWRDENVKRLGLVTSC